MITEQSTEQQQQSTTTPESMVSSTSPHPASQQPQPQVGRVALDDNSLESMSVAIAAAIEMANSGQPASSLNSGSASILRPGTATSTVISTAATQVNRSRSASVRSIFSNASRKSSVVNSQTPLSEPFGHGMVARPKRSSSLSSQQSAMPPSRRSSSSSSSNRHYSARFSWFTGPVAEETERNQATKEESKEWDSTAAEETRPSQDTVDDGRRELMYRGIRVKEMRTTLKTMVIPHDVENPMPQIKLERPGFARINY